MKSDFEEKKRNRIERFEELSVKKNDESNSRLQKARDMGSVIPMGQPILVGHHSEKRDRSYRNKIDQNMRKGIEAEKKSKYYADKAESAKNNKNIFSDDPTAIEQLKEKIERLTKIQNDMKQINKIYRSKKTNEEKKVDLAKIGLSEQLKNIISSQNFFGFPHYKLTNNNAKIKNAKIRLAQLIKLEKDITTEKIINGIKIIDNVEDNRLQMFFDSKPEPEIIKQLKSGGLRWAHTLGCWQRHRSNIATWEAERIAGLINNEQEI